ncbi:MAG: peroxide stress protein YaaA, partial [Mariprofundaceae bacterium]
MLLIVSPAKKLDIEKPAPLQTFSQPQYLDEAARLIGILRELDSFQIADLMKLSIKLADLNMARYQQWHTPFTADNSKQAIFAFQGDVYQGMDAASMSEDDIDFAQRHLRILSGLYGLLRPLDLMQAYRLEMGTRLNNPRGRDLYAFWGEIITEALNQALAEQGDNILINLASNEYFRAVHPSALKAEIITPQFKELRGDRYKIISFSAKKARGMMSRYIIKHHLQDPEAIKAFDADGYNYNPELSEGNNWVFS